MKRLMTIFLSALVILLVTVPAGAAQQVHVFELWDLTDAGVTVFGDNDGRFPSGCTTAATQDTSGVSPMAVTGGERGSTSEFYTIDLRGSQGNIMAVIQDMDPSQAATGTSDFSSATTGYFYAKFLNYMEDGTPGQAEWDSADLVPLFINMAINSGVSDDPKYMKPPPATHMRTYFRPSGNTPFNNAILKIITGINAQERGEANAILIGARTYTLDSTSGTSTTASDDSGNGLPSSAQAGELQVIGNSGNSLFYTRDTTTINKATANTLQEGDYRELGRREMENLKMEALGDITVRIQMFTAKP